MNKENISVLRTAGICIALIVIILATFFNAVMGDETPKSQTEISVILYHAGSDGWESMMEGMKQAEDDFAVNINYVILRESADGQEQLEMIQREIDNGAQGVIVAVCAYSEMYEGLERISNTAPVIAVESGVGDSMIPLFSADNYEMGRMLGEQILEDFQDRENLTVALVRENVNRDSVEQREQGFRDALAGKAKIISLGAAINGEIADAAAAFHKESLLEMTERTDVALRDTKNYGIGNTTSIVAALDKGNLEKLIFQNEFNMGYLAVEALLQDISGENKNTVKDMDYYCVSRKEVYETQYERLLFPIVE